MPQLARLEDGRTVAQGLCDGIADYNRDKHGIPLGAVIGATLSERQELYALRLQDALMLVPGIGAQGATFSDVKSGFGSTRNRVIPSISRQVYQPGPNLNAIKEEIRKQASAAREALF